MPNTVSTPHATSVSTSTSETERGRSVTSGSATYTPSGRSSTSNATGASSKPSGGRPVDGL
jgi:hypothetical protein